MMRTILPGDHILTNNWAYGLPGFARSRDVPARGDIITFVYPEDRSRLFLKRVVGLPGESIAIRGKAVYINDHLLRETYTSFGGMASHEPQPEMADAPERLEDARGDGVRMDVGPDLVPPNKLFVLGDNRDNSRDSRFWGFLPQDQLKGRALLVYWSYEATREEYHPTGYLTWLKDTLSAFGKTRWRRFFHLIR